MKKNLLALATAISITTLAAQAAHATKIPILTDTATLNALNISFIYKEEKLGLSYTLVSEKQRAELQHYAHENKRCAGFEALPPQNDSQNSVLSSQDFENLFTDLHTQAKRELTYQKFAANKNTQQPQSPKPTAKSASTLENPRITEALAKLSEKNIQETVEWLSAYQNRYNRAPTANVHVLDMKTKLEALLKGAPFPYEISLIEHKSTPQKSIRVSIKGSKRPNEIIVLGAHFDSITNDWGGDRAPGADDNASGSSNILEALRVIKEYPQPERTLEFFWYAGEEEGLLGSAEIAKTYKQEKKNVVAVLQLDMTLFPGNGEFVLGSITDFTSSWLRDYLKEINPVYIKAKLVDDKCGYGCSDHASWYRQGYSTLLPFEATSSTMNRSIHTAQDKIDNRSNFKHSMMFTKIALVFALDLANSERKGTSINEMN